MPDWPLLVHNLLPALRSVPTPKREKLEALIRLITLLEARVKRDAAGGGIALQQTTLELIAGRAADRDLQAIMDCAASIGVSNPQLSELIDGFQLDLSQRRYRDMTQLRQYAHKRVGMIVTFGLIVLGIPSGEARQHGTKLGEGITFLAILTNFPHDLHQGRIYFPQHELEKCALTEVELVAKATTEERHHLARDFHSRIGEALACSDAVITALPDDGSRAFGKECLGRIRTLQERNAGLGGDFFRPSMVERPTTLLQKISGAFRRGVHS